MRTLVFLICLLLKPLVHGDVLESEHLVQSRVPMSLPHKATGTYGLVNQGKQPTLNSLAKNYGGSESNAFFKPMMSKDTLNNQIGGGQLGSISEQQTFNSSVKEVPWSSKSVRDAVKSLEMGQTEVRVASRMEAEELFLGRYQGNGFKNTTGMRPTEAKNLVGKKEGTYHWDIGKDAYPHEASHLQIHEGVDIIRIYFPD